MWTSVSCGKSTGLKGQDLNPSLGAAGNCENATHVFTNKRGMFAPMCDEAASFPFNISWFIICLFFSEMGLRHNQETHLGVLRCKLKVKRRPRVLARPGVLIDSAGPLATRRPASVGSGGGGARGAGRNTVAVPSHKPSSPRA